MIKDIIKKYNDKYNLYEIMAYLVVGVLTTLVNLVIYYLCTTTFLDPKNGLELQIANIIAWVVAVIFAYFTNRKYVFKSKRKDMIKEGTEFCLARVVTLLLECLTMFIMVTMLHINDKVSKLVTQVIIVIGNYIISKFFVFKKNK